MSHWMDTGRFDDDSDIERPPAPRTWNPLTLIAAQLETRFTPLGNWINAGTCVADEMDPAIWDAPPTTAELHEMTAAERPSAKASARRQRTAASTCAACPVRAQCLADARDNETTVGVIRGGVLFAAGLGRDRTEHNLIDLMHRGLLSDSPAGRGCTAASSAA